MIYYLQISDLVQHFYFSLFLFVDKVDIKFVDINFINLISLGTLYKEREIQSQCPSF